MSARTSSGCDVLYVGFLTGNGGDAVQMLHLAAGVRRRGLRVRIMMPAVDTSVGFAEQCDRLGIQCERTDLIRADLSGPKQDMKSMLSLAWSMNAPVVHVHTGNSCLPRSFMVAVELTRAPRGFVTVHSPYETIEPGSVRARFWALAAGRRFHAVISPSAHGSAFQRACGVPDSRIVTVRNAIDADQTRSGDGSGPRTELGLGPDDPLVVFTSRIEQQKRPSDAVRIFARIADEFPSARLVFVGTGAESSAVSRVAEQLGVGGRVHLVGYRVDVADWLAAATVWILPTERENFSVAVLEALAAGCPVLATACPGNDEVLIHDDNSLMFGVGDIDAGAAALRRLIGDPDLRARLSRRGAKCGQEYNVDRMVDEYAALYERFGALPFQVGEASDAERLGAVGRSGSDARRSSSPRDPSTPESDRRAVQAEVALGKGSSDIVASSLQDSPGTRLTDNFKEFQTLKLEAIRYFDRGRVGAAAVHAQIAASYAFFHHTGLWSSPELERMLVSIGQNALAPPPSGGRAAAGGSTERVLHVLTRISAIGGHSRMVWRWMDQDRARTHSVVLTRQGALPVPTLLHEAVERRGGRVQSLNRSRGTVLSWAQELRDLAAGFDMVVMHLFAEDVIPMIAFASRAGLPPILFVDQADHAFSLGPALADVYVGLREAGIDLAVERRGVTPERVAELPITLPAMKRTLTRAEAKERLGWAPDSVVMLSIARAPKYRPFEGEHYTAPFRELLDRYPDLMLVVVGPTRDETWRRVGDETGGRVLAFAERPETQTFYEAADIYIDSFPVNSNTSLLEAGSYSLPLVSRCRLPGRHTIFCADSPGFANVIFRSSDRREYIAAIERLVADPVHRRELGEKTREAVESVHVGHGWQAALERLYEQAESTSQLDVMPVGDDSPQSDEADLIWFESFSSDVPLDEIRSYYVKGLPLDLRIRAWLGISVRQRRIRPQLLAPEWVTAHLRDLSNRVRRPRG